MHDDELIAILRDAASAVRVALDDLADWGPAGTRPGQYRSDLAADAACVSVIESSGLGCLSEESGLAHHDRDIVVIVDPVDGSTNASRGIPWYATSLCAVDADGPRAAVVVNQATGRTYTATRDGGAFADGQRIEPSAVIDLSDAVVGLSGHSGRHLGWRQFRALGAAALDLCAVAEGALDGFVDCSPSAHGPWDYAAGLLVCREAGGYVVDAFDREMIVVEHAARRTPVAAATSSLLSALVDGRRSLQWADDPSIP